MNIAILTAIIAALSSSGVCSIVLYLIQRRDKHRDEAAKNAMKLSAERLEKMEQQMTGNTATIERLEKALLAQMHHTLYTKCGNVLTEVADGTRTVVDTDEFHDISIMFNAYENMGGNGTCKILFDRVSQIPLRQTAAKN